MKEENDEQLLNRSSKKSDKIIHPENIWLHLEHLSKLFFFFSDEHYCKKNHPG